MLQEITVPDFKNSAGSVQDINFTYQFFGKDKGDAPLVLVFHALSGNSEVAGPNGWWKEIVGEGKPIDLDHYSVLAFDMPGNGFDGKPENLLHNFREFTLKDIAEIFKSALKKLGIKEIFAGIGGSIGGALAWELAALEPGLFQHIFPVATDYKSSEWLKALCKVQDQILNNSAEPLKDARIHAMTFYRSPQSFKYKFGNPQINVENRKIEDWLEFHGRKLEERFQLASYKLMNHLLTTIDISNENEDVISVASTIESGIHIITVNSDNFFLPDDNWDTYVNLSLIKNNISIHEIRSIHGHDAFLIEYFQLAEFLKPVFNINKTNNETNKYSALWSR